MERLSIKFNQFLKVFHRYAAFRCFGILLVIFGWYGRLNSQNQDLFFEKVTVGSRGITSTIDGIVKDSLGFMWFATWDGLFKYDGESFAKYEHNPDQVHSIPENRIKNIIIDDRKQLWIRTPNNYYARYIYEKDYFIPVPEQNIPEFLREKLRADHDKIILSMRIKG